METIKIISCLIEKDLVRTKKNRKFPRIRVVPPSKWCNSGRIFGNGNKNKKNKKNKIRKNQPTLIKKYIPITNFLVNEKLNKNSNQNSNKITYFSMDKLDIP